MPLIKRKYFLRISSQISCLPIPEQLRGYPYILSSSNKSYQNKHKEIDE